MVGLCTTAATRARADKPLIAVLPFIGPQATSAEAVVVRALRKKAALVPYSDWQASAKKLFAPSHSPDDIQAVAQDLGAQMVVTGVVKRDGRAFQLAVSMRDGKSGRSLEKLKYPLKGPRIEPQTLELLGTEANAAFDRALAAINGDEGEEEETPPKKPQPKPAKPPVAQKPQPSAAPGAEEPSKPVRTAHAPPPAVVEKEETAPGMAKSEPAPAANPALASAHRPRWAPYFDLSLGGSVSGRSFDFQPASLPKFSSGVVGGLHADLTFYPLAGKWRAAKGLLAGLGIGATIDYPVWPPSKGPDATQYDTQELSFSAGVRWRIPLYKLMPRPELLILAGGGYHSFTIAKRTDPTSGNLTDVGPPDIGLAYLGFGVGLRLHFADWARLWFTFEYHAVLDAGAATSNQEYGPATVFGVRPAGGLDFFLYRGLKIGAAGHYERYQLSFTGSDPPPQKPGHGELAQSATDQYFGITFFTGYEF